MEQRPTRQMSCSNHFSAKLPEEFNCYLNGVLIIPGSDEICVLDRENAKLKKFSLNGELIHCLSLIDIPHSMCLIPESREIVITKPDKSVLELIDTCVGHFVIRKYIGTDKKYFGICCIGKDLLAVSSWSQLCVDILDINGHVLHSISEQPCSNTPLFRAPNEVPDILCGTPNMDIVISELNSFVTCIDKEGNQKWKVNVGGPIGDLCFDRKKKRIIVSLKEKGTVLSMNEKGMEIKELVSLKDMHLTPLSVCMCDNGLLVTEKGGEVYCIKDLESSP